MDTMDNYSNISVSTSVLDTNPSVNSSSYTEEMNSIRPIFNDPCHRTMLHILEQLLHHKGVPLTINQLYESMTQSQTTINDLRTFFDSTNSLKYFLTKYPSLFRVEGEFVHASVEDSVFNNVALSDNFDVPLFSTVSSMNDGGGGTNSGVRLRHQLQHHHVDLSTESEAVKYFQNRLLSRPDRYILIRSLAGHLSQATENIRTAVGPQSRFRDFLLRHPLVFEIQGDLVGLRDRFSALCLSSHNRNSTGNFRKQQCGGGPRPKSLILPNNIPSNVANGNYYSGTDSTASSSSGIKPASSSITTTTTTTTTNAIKTRPVYRPPGARPLSMVMKVVTGSNEEDKESVPENFSRRNTDPQSNQNNKNYISTEEFQAALFLKNVLQKQPQNTMELGQLFVNLARAPANIRDCVGWTRVELEQFIRKMPTLLELSPVSSSNHHYGDNTSWKVRSIEQSFNMLEAIAPKMIPASSSNVLKHSNSFESSTSEINNMSVSSSTGLTQPPTSSVTRGARTVVNHNGLVYHITKLWGIIDLGQHEHVFFDISIFKHLENLEKHFRVGELVFFNAILAPKKSRAKWRATQVWKEADHDVVKHLCSDLVTPLFGGSVPKFPHAPILNSDDNNNNGNIDLNSKSFSGTHHHCEYDFEDDDQFSLYSPSVLLEQQVVRDNQRSIDNELAEIMQLSKVDGYDDDDDDDNNHANDESTSLLSTSTRLSSSSGVVPSNGGDPSNGGGSQQQKMHKKSTKKKSNHNRTNKQLVNMATQTISTGEIMSVCVYHD